MRKQKFNLLFLFFAAFTFGCKENPVENNETLIFQLEGVIETLEGDCAGVQVRTRSFGNLDLTNTQKVKFNFSGMSDADLSSINIYYLVNNGPVYLINLPDRDQINVTNSVELNSPNINEELFLRVTLKSSVCTGQIFSLTFSDLKIYTK
ncbi:MAG: hypothetical protein M3R36_00015 [Bacteroidota bacterium]|nr:hypothetical protein [Bacteroidota bacterium]